MQLLRSLLFNGFMWTSVLFYAPLALLTAPFPFRFRYRFICAWAHFQIWLLGALCGLKYRVRGREHLPQGAAIVLSKHQSTWETLAFAEIFPPHAWVLKREVIWIPLFGWAVGLMKPIAIDRGSGRRAIQQVVAQGRARLKDGMWVLIFPEGTRVAPGQQRRWGSGGAMLAAKSGYPVVPVAHNAGHYWRRRGFVKRPGTIDVVIGPPIDTRGKTAEEINRAAESWIARAMEPLETASAETQSRD